MKNEIFSLWYKQPSMLTSTPTMARMIRTEGIEAYGLYIHFADTLHLVGGFQEYNLNDISLTLGYTKKLIKAKLNRVLNDYKLFDFFLDDDGIEYIGLERIKNDIASLNKHKENGAKGGKKRAENYRNKSFKPVEKPVSQKPVTDNPETQVYEIPSFFKEGKYPTQINLLKNHSFTPRAKQQAYKDYMLKTYPDMREEIEKSI
jgi:hypothetical protein